MTTRLYRRGALRASKSFFYIRRPYSPSKADLALFKANFSFGMCVPATVSPPVCIGHEPESG